VRLDRNLERSEERATPAVVVAARKEIIEGAVAMVKQVLDEIV